MALCGTLPPACLQVVSKPGATIDDSEMVDGLVLDLKAGGVGKGGWAVGCSIWVVGDEV